MKKIKKAVLKAIPDGKEVEDIEVPEYYEPATNWQIPGALEFLLNFYSKSNT